MGLFPPSFMAFLLAAGLRLATLSPLLPDKQAGSHRRPTPSEGGEGAGDLFINQMNLLDQAIKLAAEMDEPLDQNYVRKHALEQAEELGISVRQAATRVFSDQGPGPPAVSDPIWGRS